MSRRGLRRGRRRRLRDRRGWRLHLGLRAAGQGTREDTGRDESDDEPGEFGHG